MQFVEECVAPSIHQQSENLKDIKNVEKFFAAKFNVYQAEQSIIGLQNEISKLGADDKQILELQKKIEEEKTKITSSTKIATDDPAEAQQLAGAQRQANSFAKEPKNAQRFPPVPEKQQGSNLKQPGPGTPLQTPGKAPVKPGAAPETKVETEAKETCKTEELNFMIGKSSVNVNLSADCKDKNSSLRKPEVSLPKAKVRLQDAAVACVYDFAEKPIAAMDACVTLERTDALRAYHDAKIAKLLLIVNTIVSDAKAAAGAYTSAIVLRDKQQAINRLENPATKAQVDLLAKHKTEVSNQLKILTDKGSSYRLKAAELPKLIETRNRIQPALKSIPTLPEFPESPTLKKEDE